MPFPQDKCEHCPVKDGLCRAQEMRHARICWHVEQHLAGTGNHVSEQWHDSLTGKIPEKITHQSATIEAIKNVGQMIGSAATAAAKFVANGAPVVNGNMQEERMNICRSCDQFDEQSIRCKDCKCFLEVKSRMATEVCPLNKWPSVNLLPTRQCGGCQAKNASNHPNPR